MLPNTTSSASDETFYSYSQLNCCFYDSPTYPALEYVSIKIHIELPLFSVVTTSASAASPQPFLVCAVMRNT